MVNQPIITIFCAFTREWAVDRWIANLRAIEHNPELTNLVFIIDLNSQEILSKLQRLYLKDGYRNLKIKINKEHIPTEISTLKRRERIAFIKNQSRDLISMVDGEYVVALEDDTVFEKPYMLHDLIIPIMSDRTIGFVEGVQCGRWGVKMIGAWRVDDCENPHKVWTVKAKKGYTEIDGGGFYGYATTRTLYLAHDYSWDNEPWGPDVNFGLWLRRQGLKCLIHWDTVFGHDDYGRILYPDDNVAQVVYHKSNHSNLWDRIE